MSKCTLGVDNAQIVHIFSRVIHVYLAIFICFYYSIVPKCVYIAFEAKSKEMEEKVKKLEVLPFPRSSSMSFKHFTRRNPSFHHSKARWQETIKFGSWTKYQMKDQKHGKTAENQPIGNSSNRSVGPKCKFQPIGNSSNRSAGPLCLIQPIGAFPQPNGWNSRTEFAKGVLLHSTPF